MTDTRFIPITKPMLSGTVHAADLERVEWPVLASPKLDGIRCLIHPALGPVTRSLKMVPNVFVRDTLYRGLNGSCLDGELIATDSTGRHLSFNETQSAMMRQHGRCHFEYHVFDCFQRPLNSFRVRLREAKIVIQTVGSVFSVLEHRVVITYVHHALLNNSVEFLEYAAECVAKGYEGAMIRATDGPYKSGRSTLRQGWLLKYKEWADAEGTVIGFEELLHNDNPDVRDEMDQAKRSSCKDGMVPMETLGALVLDTEWGTLSIGTGFDQATRTAIWEDRDQCIGRKVTFKYQAFGMQNLPRFPVFMHFRQD